MPDAAVSYEPEGAIGRGYPALGREIWRELVGSGWLIRQLFRREIVGTTQQSLLGLGWLVLTPLASVATFFLLDSAGVIDVGELDAPYPLYAVLGIASWQLFASGLVACTQSLAGAGEMLTKIRFSRKALVIAALGRGVLAFAVQLGLVALLLGVYGVAPRAELLWLPFVVLPLLALTLGLGFVLSLLHVVARDVGNALTTLLTFGLFLTPVLYAKPATGLLALASDWNPLYHLVVAGRDLALAGAIAQPAAFAASSLLAFGVLVVGTLVFHVSESRLAERV